MTERPRGVLEWYDDGIQVLEQFRERAHRLAAAGAPIDASDMTAAVKLCGELVALHDPRTGEARRVPDQHGR